MRDLRDEVSSELTAAKLDDQHQLEAAFSEQIDAAAERYKVIEDLLRPINSEVMDEISKQAEHFEQEKKTVQAQIERQLHHLAWMRPRAERSKSCAISASRGFPLRSWLLWLAVMDCPNFAFECADESCNVLYSLAHSLLQLLSQLVSVKIVRDN